MGDKMFLTVTLYYNMIRFGWIGKLVLRFAGPFEILECVGKVAY